MYAQKTDSAVFGDHVEVGDHPIFQWANATMTESIRSKQVNQLIYNVG
jgi:hypothetical protein